MRILTKPISPWCRLAALIAVTAGCGGGAPTHPTPAKQGAAAQPTALEAVHFAPSVAIPAGEAKHTASGVLYQDVVVGTGAMAARSLEIKVLYAVYLTDGVLVGGGPTADQLTVTLAPESVIRGWYDAVPGMRVGGMRRLIVPAKLGYGASAHGNIPANSILVFDIQLLAVR